MEENEILQKFPLFKFSCGCEIDSVEADRQRNSKAFNFDHTLHCKTHPEGRLVCRIAKCLDCGVLYQFSKSGAQKPRCNDCRIKHRKKHVNEYSKWYFKHGAYGRYKKGVNRKVLEKVKTKLIKTGLMPNPVIVNPKISPCLQGCQLLSENKDNTTCVHECEYRVKFLKTIFA